MARIDDLRRRASERERAEDWEGADEVYVQIAQLAFETRAIPDLVDAILGQARASRKRGRVEEARDLAEVGREIAERGALEQKVGWAWYELAMVYHRAADLVTAKTLLEETLGRALAAADETLAALARDALDGLVNPSRPPGDVPG